MTQGSGADLVKRLAEDKDLYLPKEISPRLYIFFSFDLVNSTLYKNEQKKEWPIVFRHFYQLINREMKKRFPGIKLWKYIGDEVLFYKVLDSATDLFKIIPESFEALTSTLKHLNDSFYKIFKPLSLKGTTWQF